MNFDKSKIFHPFNSDMAKKYIGCKGWFSDNFLDLDKSVPPTVLTDVCNNTDFPFAYSKTGYNESLFRYFLPAEEKPEYRPFETIEEAEPHIGRKIKTKGGFAVRLLDLLECYTDGVLSFGCSSAQEIFNEYIFADDGMPVGVRK